MTTTIDVRRRRRKSTLLGGAAVILFLASHLFMGWFHLLLVPFAILLVIPVLLPNRGHPSGSPDARRYDRIAVVYDWAQAPMELWAGRWRRRLWERATGRRILELGVGTGKSLRFYPVDRVVVGIDFSPRMLARARRRLQRTGGTAQLLEADAQLLPFPDGSFDTVVTTFVFCSVPNPLRGLREARRVLRPGGQLLMLEHVMSRGRILGPLMRWLDPLVLKLWGSHIARQTVDNVRLAGFEDICAEDLALDVIKRIEARA